MQVICYCNNCYRLKHDELIVLNEQSIEGMNELIELISQPWPWYVSGPLISLILFLFFYFGKSFGVSSNLETMCTIAGADKLSDYFKKDWKERDWALVFLIGLIIGGFISTYFLTPNGIDSINPETVKELETLGFSYQQNS